jgi:hypothetical protein
LCCVAELEDVLRKVHVRVGVQVDLHARARWIAQVQGLRGEGVVASWFAQGVLAWELVLLV